MKRLIAFLTIAGMLTFGATNLVLAQDQDSTASVEVTETIQEQSAPEDTTAAVDVAKDIAATEAGVAEKAGEEKQSFHEVIKDQFIDGTPEFMGVVLIALILGLAICIERIIYLNLSTTNTKKLLNKVEAALQSGKGIEAAKEVCRNTRGPVASIFVQGLDRYENGLEDVEKSIVSYGGVLTGRLESGISWISLFIALAPMLGFMGTVIGMISAFDNIAAAGDISPTVVASGIKVALLTTVFGLIVAIILQIFYNYIVSKIDSLVNEMEDSTITFIDILNEYKK
ncbi:MAG: MotA/TolQ/ExbB proton channel family protein [Hyphomicrobiales bacterium]